MRICVELSGTEDVTSLHANNLQLCTTDALVLHALNVVWSASSFSLKTKQKCFSTMYQIYTILPCLKAKTFLSCLKVAVKNKSKMINGLTQVIQCISIVNMFNNFLQLVKTTPDYQMICFVYRCVLIQILCLCIHVILL